jgi:hypothetical protein
MLYLAGNSTPYPWQFTKYFAGFFAERLPTGNQADLWVIDWPKTKGLRAAIEDQ